MAVGPGHGGARRVPPLGVAVPWRVLEAGGRDLAVIDSAPVPVVGYHHAGGDHRWWGEADFGRAPAKKQRLHGSKRMCQQWAEAGCRELSRTV